MNKRGNKDINIPFVVPERFEKVKKDTLALLF